jgi:hypothetical protein
VALRRLELLQWFALVAGPLAFAVQHVSGLGIDMAQCSPAGSRWGVHVHLVQGLVFGLAVAAILAGEAAAILAYRATRGVELEGDPPPGRIRFLATAALAVGPIFLTIVLLSGLGGLFHAECHQA